MIEHVDEGDAILYMKIGTHATEPLDDIIARKKQEISDAGFSMWGYGGNTCHPRTTVQPFASSHAAEGRVIRLLMQPMHSNHFADPVPADEYSVDGLRWLPVPAGIEVRGSRFALCIRNLEQVHWKLPLEATRVAIGNCRGRRGSLYIKGRVDKACLEVVGSYDLESVSSAGPVAEIGLVAELIKPYSVLLRSDQE